MSKVENVISQVAIKKFGCRAFNFNVVVCSELKYICWGLSVSECICRYRRISGCACDLGKSVDHKKDNECNGIQDFHWLEIGQLALGNLETSRSSGFPSRCVDSPPEALKVKSIQ